MDEIWQRLAGLPSAIPESEPPPSAAVLVPLYEDHEGRVRVVLIKRPGHMRTHAGQLAFPGGMSSSDDADLVATALREAWEEVGIAPEEVQVLGFLPPVRAARTELLVAPVVGRLASRPELRPDPNEVELVIEPPLQAFFVDAGWRSEDREGHQLWFFEVEEEILWGASARMMRQLVAAAQP